MKRATLSLWRSKNVRRYFAPKKKAWRWLALTYRCQGSLCPAHTLGILGIVLVRSPLRDTPVSYRLSVARDIHSLKCSDGQFKFCIEWAFRPLTDRTLKM